jgi:hypothetical protein
LTGVKSQSEISRDPGNNQKQYEDKCELNERLPFVLRAKMFG